MLWIAECAMASSRIFHNGSTRAATLRNLVGTFLNLAQLLMLRRINIPDIATAIDD